MITLKDIAKETGFSVTTVSRALNNYPDVSQKTKKIIQDKANMLNYTPNIIAQNLVMKKSKTIGLLVTDLKREGLKDNFTYEVLCGVTEESMLFDYEIILLTTTSSRQKNKNFQQVVNERKLDGIVVQGLKMDDAYLEEAIHSNTPTVLIDIPIENETTGYVTSNQTTSVFNAILYLYQLGHKNIAFMNGHAQAYVSDIRFNAYKDALDHLKIPFKESFVAHGDYSEEISYQAFINLILQNPKITAIFCASDIMALGVLKAAKELNIKVPENLSVIGFDNILLTQYVTPTLSTIAQHPFILGKEAVSLLISIINNNSETPHHRIINNDFIVRESTSKISLD